MTSTSRDETSIAISIIQGWVNILYLSSDLYNIHVIRNPDNTGWILSILRLRFDNAGEGVDEGRVLADGIQQVKRNRMFPSDLLELAGNVFPQVPASREEQRQDLYPRDASRYQFGHSGLERRLAQFHEGENDGLVDSWLQVLFQRLERGTPASIAGTVGQQNHGGLCHAAP